MIIYQAWYTGMSTEYFSKSSLLFMDGFKSGNEDQVGANVFSGNFNTAIKHKLPPETSVFSTETWAAGYISN